MKEKSPIRDVGCTESLVSANQALSTQRREVAGWHNLYDFADFHRGKILSEAAIAKARVY